MQWRKLRSGNFQNLVTRLMNNEINTENEHVDFDTDARFDVSERCWCGWKSKSVSRFSRDYLECERCATHFARRRIKSEAVSSFYSYRGYWQKRQMHKEHPILEERQAIFVEDGIQTKKQNQLSSILIWSGRPLIRMTAGLFQLKTMSCHWLFQYLMVLQPQIKLLRLVFPN